MGREEMNTFLRDRRQKLNKAAKLRKNRIVKNFHKHVEGVEIPVPSDDPQAQRSAQFYRQVFQAGPQLQKVKQPKHEKKVEEKDVVEESLGKIQQLKEKKKRILKKLGHQKTSKGQPVMRNYIKYALTKLQETLEQQKVAKYRKQRDECKK